MEINLASELALPHHGMRINTQDGGGFAERRHRHEFYQEQGAAFFLVENLHSFLHLKGETMSKRKLCSCQPVVGGEMS